MTDSRILSPEAATLVDRYLDDLARMLAGVDPTDRADALGSVREHVDDALDELDGPVTPRDVADVLRRLGAPEDVAHDLLERGIVTSNLAAPDESHAARPGDGVATTALVLGVVAVLLPVLGLVPGVAALVLARRARRLGTAHEGRRIVALVLGVVAIVVGLLVLAGFATTFAFWTDGGSQSGEVATVAALVTAPPAVS